MGCEDIPVGHQDIPTGCEDIPLRQEDIPAGQDDILSGYMVSQQDVRRSWWDMTKTQRQGTQIHNIDISSVFPIADTLLDYIHADARSQLLHVAHQHQMLNPHTHA